MSRTVLYGRRAVVGVVGLVAAATVPIVMTATATPLAAASGADTMVYAFGTASFQGSAEGLPLKAPVISMAQTPDGAGYWLLAQDGAVFAFGAPFHGSIAGWPLRLPASALAATPDAGGYWIATEDGAVFPLGNARSFGDMFGRHLAAPITDIIPVADGLGYYLVAEDGGVFAFGSAQFFGSTGGMRLNAPVLGMAAAPGGAGYWLIARDGGVFSFGVAPFHGSTGGMRLNAPVVGMASTGTGDGYWLAAEDGGVFSFGNTQFLGNPVGALASGRRVVQLVGMPRGDGYRMLALPRVADVGLVGLNDRGPAVSDLQFRLETLGYWTGGVNGVYGPLTQQAVWAFQKANGLGRTGIIDPTTRNAFRNARRVTPQSTSGYVIEVDKARQVLIVARNGRAEYVFNTSTGTERPYTFEGVQYLADTPPGRWRVGSEVDGYRTGPLGTLYRPKYFHPDGIAFHGYTSVPPTPASHGCVRLTNAAINFVWDADIIPVGTNVWVY
ncbi:MAG: L,D-transpeptidase family protein [Actinomycetota bacterium]